VGIRRVAGHAVTHAPQVTPIDFVQFRRYRHCQLHRAKTATYTVALSHNLFALNASRAQTVAATANGSAQAARSAASLALASVASTSSPSGPTQSPATKRPGTSGTAGPGRPARPLRLATGIAL